MSRAARHIALCSAAIVSMPALVLATGCGKTQSTSEANATSASSTAPSVDPSLKAKLAKEFGRKKENEDDPSQRPPAGWFVVPDGVGKKEVAGSAMRFSRAAIDIVRPNGEVDRRFALFTSSSEKAWIGESGKIKFDVVQTGDDTLKVTSSGQELSLRKAGGVQSDGFDAVIKRSLTAQESYEKAAACCDAAFTAMGGTCRRDDELDPASSKTNTAFMNGIALLLKSKGKPLPAECAPPNADAGI